MKPVCFIIMPFGSKKYKLKGGKEDERITIDFNDVYKTIIHPAIVDAGMDPVRADEEHTRGSIHKPMFERIILSDYVVADLTGANANVFYELGIRHAVKPFTTISIYSNNCELPFDLAPFRTSPYIFSEKDGLLNAAEVKKGITADLLDSKINKTTDSPVYQLVNGIQFQNSVAHEKTDIFREKVEYDNALKQELKNARNTGETNTEKVIALEKLINSKLMPLEDQEAAVLIDIMLSYRDLSAFYQMQEFIEKLPRHVRQTVMVQEQYGFVLNRNKKKEDAIEILEKTIQEHGPSSETYGILGRVYKDYITENYYKGAIDMALSYLDDALNAYQKGFEADWRDAYPGINYVTCLELKGDRASIEKVLPVVEYAVLMKKQKSKPDYWDEATLAELAVIANDYDKTRRYLIEAKKRNPVGWMLKTTNKNFIMIRDFRKRRGENVEELEKIIKSLSES
jgi:tetratricopeptide (TPR) repeat protein